VDKADESPAPIPLAVDIEGTGKADPSVEEKVLSNVGAVDAGSTEAKASEEPTKPVVDSADEPAKDAVKTE
jgi:hypothetical protein